MSNNIDNDYVININIDDANYKYNNLQKSSILLKGHHVLPQNYKFMYPKLSKNGKFITAIGKAKEEKKDDIIFIWTAENLKKRRNMVFLGTSKIEAVEFSPDETFFAVIYKNMPYSFFDFSKKGNICFFNYETGNEIARSVKFDYESKKIISYSFSKEGERFAVATDKDFIIYNAKTALIYLRIESDAKIKVWRGKTVVLINDNFSIDIYEIKYWNNPSKDKINDSDTFFSKRIEVKGKMNSLSITEYGEIICAKISPENDYIYFITQNGVFRILIKESPDLEQLQEKEIQIINGDISDECNLFMLTDMMNIYFWSFGPKKELGFIKKEKFDSFSVNFYQSKLLTIDDICLDITDIGITSSEEKYIWLDKNYDLSNIISYSFSPDYRVILIKIDDNSAVAYNTFDGTVIRKWKVDLPNWSVACQMVPKTSKIGVIATKSYNKKIKVWDYLTGTDLCTFEDFDVNNFCFSKYGNFLFAGTTEGKEIARGWNLKQEGKNSYSFYYDNSEQEIKNKNTFISIYIDPNVSSSMIDEDNIDSIRIIAVAENQNPLIFQFNKTQLIRECEGCPIQLSYIKDVQIQEIYNLFYIYGKDINNNLTAIIFDLNGEMLGEFNNCRNIEFSPNIKCLLSDSDDINSKLLTITHIDESNNFNPIECNISGVYSKFLSDGKNIVSIIDTGENKKTIYFTQASDGENIAEIHFEKKTKNNTFIDLNLDESNNNITFRFIEFLDVEEEKIK